jgi:hypothetical protein
MESSHLRILVSGIEIQLPGPGETGGEHCHVSGIKGDDDLVEAGSPSLPNLMFGGLGGRDAMIGQFDKREDNIAKAAHKGNERAQSKRKVGQAIGKGTKQAIGSALLHMTEVARVLTACFKGYKASHWWRSSASSSARD